MAPNAREDFPDPETPVNTVSRRLGRSREMSARLFSLAPRTWITSWLSAAAWPPASKLEGTTDRGGAPMAVQLNHTIVRVRDKRESAGFLAELLGVGPPTAYGPFLVVQVDNDVSLDFADDHGPVHPQHYAFLVGEDEFDQIFGRIRERGLPYWADPGRRRPGEINTNDGGRGVYWEDPSGHFLEIITRPYGSGS
jgi:extradiol dioxygenase family protein